MKEIQKIIDEPNWRKITISQILLTKFSRFDIVVESKAVLDVDIESWACRETEKNEFEQRKEKIYIFRKSLIIWENII